ncbi:hypothetical protein EHS13_31375 [Paenibacillus psychroresistens]|uniref:Uncharacterized protein n=1 Tax=Paenibacillus psychroresistens TaxID=1778678 RepID=A0A6B8RRN8_9BACL|nr:hypothetical protein [Paenibacillus psychroresistens]QGQ99060.1 hypothetical protein EHS13_31375 [Paenibacillus psychroresistens]
MIIIFAAVLIQIPLHFGYAVGDFLFRIFGFSPWTKGDQGLHLPFILSSILLIWGIKGVLESSQPERRKLLKRTVIGCIALILLLPMIVEKATFMIRHNTTGLASIDYSKKKSKCSYLSEEKQIKANCSFTLYNYGNLTTITLNPIMKNSLSAFQFEPIEISISPHSKVTLGMPFLAKQSNGNSLYGGVSNNIDLVIALP